MIRHRARLQQPYELVCASLPPGEIDAAIQTLTHEIGAELCLMAISAMERVDIGDGASMLEQLPITVIGPLERLQQRDCALGGFYRPFLMHVIPDEGVRSFYAVGNGWLGNFGQDPLPVFRERFNE